MTYLILHRVRGEPAFDIADKLEGSGTSSDPGPWWIIPTSGHRAYPYRWWALEDLRDVSDINEHGSNIDPNNSVARLPADWPDHYQAQIAIAPVRARKPDAYQDLINLFS